MVDVFFYGGIDSWNKFRKWKQEKFYNKDIIKKYEESCMLQCLPSNKEFYSKTPYYLPELKLSTGN